MRTRLYAAGLGVAFALFLTPQASAQILGRNLITNGDAESGAAATDSTVPVSTVPGWTRTGSANVVPYGGNVGVLTRDNPSPLSAGKNYFEGGPSTADSSLAQTIDVSSQAQTIDLGNVVYDASAYLGGIYQQSDNAVMIVKFLSSAGAVLNTATLGPVMNNDPNTNLSGLFYRRQIGLVPASTRSISVTLQFVHGDGASYNNGAADNAALFLNPPSSPGSVFGTNLIVNGTADESREAHDSQPMSTDVPGWSRTGQFDVLAYGNDLDANSPGPTDRGANYFWGGQESPLSTGYQDIDVSAGATQIDKGNVTYNASAYLGGFASQEDNAVLTIQFQDWSGRVLGNTQLGPVTSSDRGSSSGLLQRTQSGTVPVGTRVVHVLLTLTRLEGTNNDGYADDLSLILTAPSVTPAPSIRSSSGAISAGAYGGFTNVAPGTWMEIYGANLSTTTRPWKGSDFNGSQAPTSLDNVKVTVGGQPAYVYYVSGGQIDALIPSNVATGMQQVIVSNSQGTSEPYTVEMSATQPGFLAPPVFNISGIQYAAALLPPQNGQNVFAIPTNAINGVLSRPAHPGETLVIYGIGFGPVTPDTPAGTVVGGQNKITGDLQVSFGGTPATVSYQGLAPGYTGLYQFNFVVPNVSSSDPVPVTFTLNGVPSAQTLYVSVQ